MSTGLVSRRKLPTTFWINLCIVAFSIYLYMLTMNYPGMSGTLPRLVLIMICIITAVDVIQILHKRRLQENSSTSPSKTGVRLHYDKVFYTAVLMPIFFVFLRLIGVILGTCVFVFISGWILGYRKLTSLLISSIIVAAAVYVIFVVIMDTFLPKAYLFGLIGG